MKTPLLLPILGLLSLCPIAATAQQSDGAERYPARPVKVIVPYGAGAAADVIARIAAQKLSEDSGTQFYVENLPGAGGVTGTLAASRAPADGYTLLVVNQDFVIQPLVKSKPTYDPFKNFIAVASLAGAPETISVHPSVPAANMKELIELLKANPGKYSYASPGYGTSPMLQSIDSLSSRTNWTSCRCRFRVAAPRSCRRSPATRKFCTSRFRSWPVTSKRASCVDSRLQTPSALRSFRMFRH